MSASHFLGSSFPFPSISSSCFFSPSVQAAARKAAQCNTPEKCKPFLHGACSILGNEVLWTLGIHGEGASALFPAIPSPAFLSCRG